MATWRTYPRGGLALRFLGDVNLLLDVVVDVLFLGGEVEFHLSWLALLSWYREFVLLGQGES